MNASLIALLLCFTLGIEAADKAMKVTNDCTCEGSIAYGKTTVKYGSGNSKKDQLDPSCSYPDNKLHQGMQNNDGICPKGSILRRIVEECYCNKLGKKIAKITYYNKGKVELTTELQDKCKGKKSDLIKCGPEKDERAEKEAVQIDNDKKKLDLKENAEHAGKVSDEAAEKGCPTGWQKNKWAVDGKWEKVTSNDIDSPKKCVDECMKMKATDNSISHANYMNDPKSTPPHACCCTSGSKVIRPVAKGYDVCALQKPEKDERAEKEAVQIDNGEKKLDLEENTENTGKVSDEAAEKACPTGWQKNKWAVDGKWDSVTSNDINTPKKCVDECMKKKATDNSISHANYMDNPRSTPPQTCYCMSGSKVIRQLFKGYDVCALQKPEKDERPEKEAVPINNDEKKLDVEEKTENTGKGSDEKKEKGKEKFAEFLDEFMKILGSDK